MKKDADQLEASLQRAARGERIEGKLAPLVQTAQLASSLAEPPPPPPNQLASGRQRFLTEAALVRASKTDARKRAAWKPGTLRLVGALLAAVLVLGTLFGAGQAAADSLPGGPLYTLKLAAEATRMQWTTNPEARADLASALVAERLDEITRLIEQKQLVDEPTASRAKEQLVQTLQAIHQVEGQAALQSSQQLENILRVGEQAIHDAIGARPETEQGSVQDLLREIERVRQELHTGQGETSGEQQRLRPGIPPNLPDASDPVGQPGYGPRPADETSGPEPDEGPGLGPGAQPEEKPVGPEPDKDAGAGPGPWPEERPTRPQQPAGPQPDEDPGPGPGDQPAEDPGPGSGSQQPSGPQPNEDPGPGSGSQPDGDPGPGSGDQPDGDSGSGSGPHQPPGPQPNEDSDPGPDPQQPGEAQPPEPTGTDPGNGKP